MCTLSKINVLRSLCSVLLFLVLAGNFQLPLCYILCTADNLIPCSLQENKFEVSSCSGSLCVYNIPRSYHLAELPQVFIVCYERIRQLLGSTECGLGSLLIELPVGGPSLPSLPGCLTSQEPRPLLSGRWDRQERKNSRPSQGVLFQMKPNGWFHSSLWHILATMDMLCAPDEALTCLSSLLPLCSPSFPPCLLLSLSSPQPCLTKSQLKPALQFAHAIRDHLHNIAGD